MARRNAKPDTPKATRFTLAEAEERAAQRVAQDFAATGLQAETLVAALMGSPRPLHIELAAEGVTVPSKPVAKRPRPQNADGNGRAASLDLFADSEENETNRDVVESEIPKPGHPEGFHDTLRLVPRESEVVSTEQYGLFWPTPDFAVGRLNLVAANREYLYEVQLEDAPELSGTVGGAARTFAGNWERICTLLMARNRTLGSDDPYLFLLLDSDRSGSLSPVRIVAKSADLIRISTSQEMILYSESLATGRSGHRWINNEATGERLYHRPGASHVVAVALTRDERANGLDFTYLTRLTSERTSDDVFMMMYIFSAFVPTLPLAHNSPPPSGWIDLYDVAEKIGLQPGKQTTEKRHEILRGLYDGIRFNERAVLRGERTHTYRSGRGKSAEVLQTRIESVLWRITDIELPIDGQGVDTSIPRRVRITLSEGATPLLFSAQLAQYTGQGERLSRIRGSQPGGAWARVIGLRLLNFWRIHAEKAQRATVEDEADLRRLTRRELLCEIPPKIAPMDELLRSPNPQRAIAYWDEAMKLLVGTGFLAPVGEALPGVARQKLGADGEVLPRARWQEAWQNTTVLLLPSEAVRVSLRVAITAIE